MLEASLRAFSPIVCRWSAAAPSPRRAAASTRSFGRASSRRALPASPCPSGTAGRAWRASMRPWPRKVSAITPCLAVCREPGDGAAGTAGERHGGAAAGVVAKDRDRRGSHRGGLRQLHVGQTGTAKAIFDGKRFSGRVQGVLDGGGATHVLVYLADGRPALVAADAEGVRSDLVPISTAPGRCSTSRSRMRRQWSLSAANDALAARTRVLDAGRVMLAADTLGAAQSMFDQAVAFAKERVQFGRVIGSFQGVKHTLADLATDPRAVPALVWFAAHAQDSAAR